MAASSTSLKMGELLIRSGAATEAQIAQAVPVAKKTGMPLGRVLVETGVVSPLIVRSAILAQALIHDQLLPAELAVSALNLVQGDKIQLEDALQKLGWRAEYYQRIRDLGKVLLQAGCLTQDQLNSALEISFASGLPLIRVLVLRQELPLPAAHAVLNSQQLLKERTIDATQSLLMITLAMRSSVPGEEVSRDVPTTARLGELLVAAGVITEVDLLSSVEVAVLHEKMIGGVLVRAGVIGQQLLDSALQIQRQFNQGTITWQQALNALKEAQHNAPAELQGLMEGSPPPAEETVSSGKELQAAMRQLEREKENLAFKIVNQHEEIKTNIARELHDTIIADLVMLKRYLAGERKLTTAEITDIVDHVIIQLRDVCCDFSSRQLQDLGLKATLADLLERMHQRTGIKCDFVWKGEVPELPESVRLHIFRIVQECLNNAEKYSGASAVEAIIECSPDSLITTVRDNGKGFNQDETAPISAKGGMGLYSLHERCQLIRMHYPATLTINSQEGQGSEFRLEIQLAKR